MIDDGSDAHVVDRGGRMLPETDREIVLQDFAGMFAAIDAELSRAQEHSADLANGSRSEEKQF